MAKDIGFIELKPRSYALEKRLNRAKSSEIRFRHGHIAITNYKLGDNYEFEKSLSTWDKMSFKYNLIGGYYVKALKEFRINRGYDMSLLNRFFPHYPMIVENDAYPTDRIDVDLYAEPRSDFQRVALTFMASQGEFTRNAKFTQQIIDADTGDGKCQPDDTLIPTPKGYKRLDQLKVGDKVFNIEGKPVEVLAIFPQKGKKDTYEVTLKDGRTTRCNDEHLWYVSDKYGKMRVLPLSEIMKDYKTVKIDKKGVSHESHKYYVPLPKPVQYKEKELPVHPYVLGALIGNGVLTEGALTISSGNLYVPAEVAELIGFPASFRRCDNYSYHFVKYHTTDKTSKDRQWYVQTKDFFKDLPEMIDQRSHTKHIPDIYKYNTVENRWLLLQGLMDTDGHISKDKYQLRYTTVSKRLKDDIVEIVRSLGLAVTVNKDSRTKKYKYSDCYTIYIKCPDSLKPKFFRANPKNLKRAKECAKFYHTKARNDALTIVDIKKVKPTKQRCILIDDPLHVYVSENFIPTHNTYCGVASTAFLSSKTLIIVPFSKLMNQWKESFLNFTSIPEDRIMLVQGGKACEKILEGKCKDKWVFIMMIDTLASFNKTHGDLATIDLLRMTRAHTKIVDEIHKDMKTVSMVEALSNFRMNYYMSASPGRSDQKENWIFKSLFKNVPRFGSSFKMQDEKHINIMIKKYEFCPTQKQINRMVNMKVGMNTKAYERELVYAAPDQQQSFNNALRVMLNWSKGLVKGDHKILILAQSIDFLEYIKNIADEVFPGETALYHGSLKKNEKAEALTHKVIIATSSSLGTGADIKGLQHVYNCATYANWIDATQLPGRARKLDDGTEVVYIELVNFGYRKTVKHFEKRRPWLISKSKNGKLIVVN